MKRNAILFCIALLVPSTGYALNLRFYAAGSVACGMSSMYCLMRSAFLANKAAAMASEVRQEAANLVREATNQHQDSRSSWPMDTGNPGRDIVASVALAPWAMLGEILKLEHHRRPTPLADKMESLSYHSVGHLWAGVVLACSAACLGYRALSLAR